MRINKKTNYCKISFCENYLGLSANQVYMSRKIPEGNSDLYQKWKNEIEKYEPFNHVSGFVCGKHFAHEDIDSETRKVKDDAVPTIFHPTISNGSTAPVNQTKRYCKIICCEHSNGTTDPKVHLFRTPRDPKRFEKWKIATEKINPIWPGTFICNKHFEDKDMFTKGSKMCLEEGAVPKIFQPTKAVVNVSSIMETSTQPKVPNKKVDFTDEQDFGLSCDKCVKRKSENEQLRNQMLAIKLKYEIDIQRINVERKNIALRAKDHREEIKDLRKSLRASILAEEKLKILIEERAEKRKKTKQSANDVAEGAAMNDA